MGGLRLVHRHKDVGCIAPCCSWAGEDALDLVPRYPLSDSSFYDCLAIDSYGEGGDSLPKALQPRLGLKFKQHDVNLGPKWGTRDYIRQIGDCREAIDAELSSVLTKTAKRTNPLGDAISLLSLYAQGHVYDVRVRRHKRGSSNDIIIRSLAPKASDCLVARNEEDPGDPYQERIVHLSQREMRLTGNVYEALDVNQPYAITSHAMERIWERSRERGRTFHTLMAEAFRRMRASISLVQVASMCEDRPAPAYQAIPFLDGFLIVSRRTTAAHSVDHRSGMRWNRKRVELLEEPSADEVNENTTSYRGAHLTHCATWFAATFMSESDIRSIDRVSAAIEMNSILEGADGDLWARRVEATMRRVQAEGICEAFCEELRPQQILRLQDRMLPRKDPPYNRVYALR